VGGASGTGAPADGSKLVPLRRNDGFRMLWIGQLLSGAGTEAGRLAYPLLILALTHSAVLAGAVGTARAAAVLCLQLPAGALSDRLDRRLTMITCDVMRAVLLAVHGTPAAVIGLVQAGVAAGGLLGAVAAPRLQGRVRLSTLVTAIDLAGALLFGVAALLVPSPLVAAPVALALLLAPAVNAALTAVMLRSAPEEMRGRVSNTVLMAATALATLVAGLLVQHGSGAWAMCAFAAAVAAAAVLGRILPGLRQAQSPPAAPR